MDYVYRLLRPDESYENDIEAKDTNSNTSVFDHVVYGSRGPESRYISTCGSLQALMDLKSKSRSPGDMIKIDINNLPDDIEIIDHRKNIVFT